MLVVFQLAGQIGKQQLQVFQPELRPAPGSVRAFEAQPYQQAGIDNGIKRN
jgi:hypothetical protein